MRTYFFGVGRKGRRHKLCLRDQSGKKEGGVSSSFFCCLASSSKGFFVHYATSTVKLAKVTMVRKRRLFFTHKFEQKNYEQLLQQQHTYPTTKAGMQNGSSVGI